MSTSDLNQLRKILADNNCHLTKARIATFNFLINPEPQSIKQIISKANGVIDPVSIYRNIALFERLGIVERIYVGWKYKLELSDQFMAHHHHLSCLNCGKVIDIKDEQHVNNFVSQVSKKYGFVPRRHQFEIDGHCKKCTKTNPGNKKMPILL